MFTHFGRIRLLRKYTQTKADIILVFWKKQKQKKEKKQFGVFVWNY